MPDTTLTSAVNELKTHQTQLDMDGVMVGVSRQALDIVLEALARAGLEAGKAEESMRERAGDLSALRKANIERQAIWCPDEVPDLSFRGNELSGETGEACNVIKKLERERHGWRGSRDTKEHLAEELADVVICADLCALTAGIDLASAVVAKFNATSDKVGIPVKLAAIRALPLTGVDNGSQQS